MTLTRDTVVTRLPGAASSLLSGELVVLDAEGRTVRALNCTAARVWELMDGTRSVGEVCRIVDDEFDESGATIARDVVEFLEYLCRVGLAGSAVPELPVP